jgi:hypothetical protein
VEPLVKPIPLKIVGAVEQVPRIITAWSGRRGGEVAYAATPAKGLAALVCREGREWKQWTAHPPKGEASGLWADAPARPAQATTEAAAVAAIGAAKVGAKPQPTEWRGRWSGTISCDADGRPVVTLQRQVAPYVLAQVLSGPEGWTARVRVKDTWFVRAAESRREAEASPVASMKDAITLAIELVLQVAAPACSMRDTTRRAAVDAEHAKARPLKLPADGPDATARLQHGKARKAAVEPPAPPPPPAAPRAARTPKAKVAKPAPQAAQTSVDDAKLLTLFSAALNTAVEEAP